MPEAPRLRKAAPKKVEKPPPAKEEPKGFGVQLKKSKPTERPTPSAAAAPSMPKLKKVPDSTPKPAEAVSRVDSLRLDFDIDTNIETLSIANKVDHSHSELTISGQI